MGTAQIRQNRQSARPANLVEAASRPEVGVCEQCRRKARAFDDPRGLRVVFARAEKSGEDSEVFVCGIGY